MGLKEAFKLAGLHPAHRSDAPQKYIVLFKNGARIGSLPYTAKNLAGLKRDMLLSPIQTDKSGTLHFNVLGVSSQVHAPGRSSKKFSLVDAESRHRQNPSTFKIPTQAERKAVMPGDLVKLIFTAGGNSERMWVEVVSHSGGKFSGTLDNDPSEIPGLRHGSKINFEPKHIIAITDL